MTIEEFIEARLAEDEAVANSAAHNASGEEWRYGTAGYARSGQGWVENAFGCTLTFEREGEGAVSEPVGTHIARHDPARALRQVAVLRATVELIGGMVSASQQIEAEDAVLYPLAAIWKEHPDYQQEWSG